MAGLSLMGGGQVQARTSRQSPPATTATEAAFGTAAAPADSGLSALSPTHPAGVAFWWSALSLGALVFLYFTLPE